MFFSLLSAHAKPADTLDGNYCGVIRPDENGQISFRWDSTPNLHSDRVKIKVAGEGESFQDKGEKVAFQPNFTTSLGYNISLEGESANTLSVEMSASALGKLPDSRYSIIKVEVTGPGDKEPKAYRTYVVEIDPEPGILLTYTTDYY